MPFTSQSTETTVPKPVITIPGYYYDPLSNRYFPEKNSHNKAFSDFIKQKNERIYKENTKEVVPKREEISNYSLVKRFQMLSLSKGEKDKYKQKVKETYLSNFEVVKIRSKEGDESYKLIHSEKASYIVSLNKKLMTIQELVIDENRQSNIFKVTINYENITSFKVIDRFIFIISSLRIFAFDLASLISCLEKGQNSINLAVFSENFSSHLRGVSMFPANFSWPIIKPFKDEEFLILFYKKVFSVNLSIVGSSLKEIKLNTSEVIDLGKILKDRNFNLITIQQEKGFDKISFTDICYHPTYDNILLADTKGSILIMDSSFNHQKTIQVNQVQSCIVGLFPTVSEVLVVFSDSSIHSLRKDGSLKVIYKSKVSSCFKVNKNCHLVLTEKTLEYMFYLNELGNYTCFSFLEIIPNKDLWTDGDKGTLKNGVFALIDRRYQRKVVKILED